MRLVTMGGVVHAYGKGECRSPLGVAMGASRCNGWLYGDSIYCTVENIFIPARTYQYQSMVVTVACPESDEIL